MSIQCFHDLYVVLVLLSDGCDIDILHLDPGDDHQCLPLAW